MLRQEMVSENETLLVVSGPLYGQAAEEFEKKMEFLCNSTYTTISIDLSMTVGITSPVIGKLVSIQKRLAAQSRSIRIKGCSEVLLTTFRKIKLDTLIPIEP